MFFVPDKVLLLSLAKISVGGVQNNFGLPSEHPSQNHPSAFGSTLA